MTELKTKESTLDALKKATKTNLTPEEVERQRVSFIMGSLKGDRTVTRAEVQEFLARQSGHRAA